jgi:hypothetical protein
MSRTRLEALQWFALFAGPLAWAGQHVVSYGFAAAQCNPAGRTWVVHLHVAAGVALGLALAVVLAGELCAFLAFRGTSDVGIEDDPPPGRIRFLSYAALVIGPLFLTLVLLDGIGPLAHPDCVQA